MQCASYSPLAAPGTTISGTWSLRDSTVTPVYEMVMGTVTNADLLTAARDPTGIVIPKSNSWVDANNFTSLIEHGQPYQVVFKGTVNKPVDARLVLRMPVTLLVN